MRGDDGHPGRDPMDDHVEERTDGEPEHRSERSDERREGRDGAGHEIGAPFRSYAVFDSTWVATRYVVTVGCGNFGGV